MASSQFAYAEEKDKGIYIAWQLFLLTVGSTVGALVVFGITVNDTSISGVPVSVYITFIVIMASATLVRYVLFISQFPNIGPELCPWNSILGIIPAEKVIRDDGTHLAIFTASDFRTEIKGCVKLLKDW